MGRRSRQKREKKAQEAQELGEVSGQAPPRLAGLKVRTVPDVAAVMRLRRAFDAVPESPMTAAERQVRTLLAAAPEPSGADTDGLSGEQVAELKARRQVQALLQKDERIRQIVGSMMAFRRCYAVAYRELQESLEAHQDLDPLVEDYVVLAAMHYAARPFSEHDLMQGFVSTVLPWVADVVDRHSQADADADQAGRDEGEMQRRAREVPLGFLPDADSESSTLPRGKSLVLVGWENAVLFVLDRIAEAALDSANQDSFQVVRLDDRRPPPGVDDPACVRLAPNLWAGCSDHPLGVSRLMSLHVAEKLTRPVDLVVCNDLSRAFTRGFVGRPAGANAGDGHKILRRWCDLVGSALVGGVLLPERDSPDLSGTEYEQLRQFSWLRGVCVKHVDREPGLLRVSLLGGLFSWDVSEATLHQYSKGPSGLILPAGV